MELCLFCRCQEPDSTRPYGKIRKYRPPPDTEFICSHCVILLLDADKDDLKKAYTKAMTLGLTRKARAIESFIDTGEIANDAKAKRSKRDMVRARPMQPTRPARHEIRA